MIGSIIRWLARTIFRFIGWKIVGRYPAEIKKKVLIVAPHTSSLDFYVGLLAKIFLKIDATFYAKKELFKGIQGWFLQSIGARPVDRSKHNNIVSQSIADFSNLDELTILVTPEGTRKKVERFKTGFYHIANESKVPIIPIAFDFEHKQIIIFEPHYTRGEGDKEIKEIESMFRGIKGKIPENSLT